MNIEVYRDASAFDSLAEEWNTLLSSARTNEIFLTNEWQACWWRHMGTGELCLIAFRDDRGRLTAIAPLFVTPLDSGFRTISLVGCRDVSDYLDLIVQPEHEGEVCDDLVRFLLSADAPAWDRIELCNLQESSSANAVLFQKAQQAGLHVDRRFLENCPVICLPASWEDYLGGIDKKQRHEIRRKIRRAENETEVRWGVVALPDGLPSQMESFFHLHRLSSPAKSQFMDQRMKSFFVEMTERIAAREWLHLSFLEMNGQRSAGMLSFEYNNRFQVYNSGYDPEAYGSLSPGIVLLSYCIQQSIDRRRSEFDFLRGEEEYKYRFGARPRPLYEVRISHPQSAGSQ